MAEQKSLWKPIRSYFYAAFILAGLIELCAHYIQSRGAVRENEWLEARKALEQAVEPSDLVLVAPDWADPLARKYFGGELLNIERAAFTDVSVFPRAIEVSMRGQHRAELAGFALQKEIESGPFTLRILSNPTYQPRLDQLLAHVGTPNMRVTRVDYAGQGSAGGKMEIDCPFVKTDVQSGGLGFGAPHPAKHYECPKGGMAGISILTDLDYNPRHCLLIFPPGGKSKIQIRMDAFRFGKKLHGSHGVYVHSERLLKFPPIALSLSSGEAAIGKIVHADGEGWTQFQLETPALEGQTASLSLEIESPVGLSTGGYDGAWRQYCFALDTR